MAGDVFAGSGEVRGEVVANTSMLGYQELISDPVSTGQILAMTYPQIGNYGINKEDEQGSGPAVSALLVREYSPVPSSWRSEGDLASYLETGDALGVQGIDTRALARHLAKHGTMEGILSSVDLDPKSLLAKLTGGQPSVPTFPQREKEELGSGSYRVVVVDYGISQKVLRDLRALDCTLIIVPAQTTAEEILSLSPDGIFLSPGAGDAAAFPELIKEIEKLKGVKPMFGIGFGHLLLGLAHGFNTFKLSKGERGDNIPVWDFAQERVLITSQNHGFALEVPAFDGDLQGAESLGITHLNLNEGTIEGMAYEKAFSVQFIPSLDDTCYRQFMEMMEGERNA